jgi:hypothetical protein
MITDKEKIKMYEALLHDIHFAGVAFNHERIKAFLTNISSWSYAHRSGNGELTDEEQNARIESAFKKLRDMPPDYQPPDYRALMKG